MNSIALHILSCHVPFVGGVFALALLILAWRRREPLLLEAAEYGVIAVALGSVLAWASGPASLTALEAWIDSVGSDHADRHGAIAEIVTVVWGLAAFVAMWGIILGRASRSSPRWRTPLLLALVLSGISLAAWAGHEGGRIRHTELRGAPALESSAGMTETEDR